MALTLVEAAKYSNDVLQRGVIEKIVYQDPILEKLQFKDIKGNGLTYNVESEMSGAQFYGVGDEWVESVSVIGQATAVTTILGGDADVDNFLQATRSDVNDLMGEQISAKTKAIKKAFMDMFFYGYYYAGAGGDPKGFDGLHYLIRSQAATATTYENTVCVAATASTAMALSMTKLEEAVDLVKVGAPELILMSKTMRRSINTYLHGVGGITYTDAANRRVQSLFEVPVGVSDYISNDETVDKDYSGATAVYGHDYSDGTALATDENGTTIFVLRFAPEAVCGIQSSTITVEKLGSLETKDAERVRIKWYPGLMLQNIITVSKVTGISPTGTVTV